MYGWTGKILKVDLTERTTELLELPAHVYHTYVGGRGLAGYFLSLAAPNDWHHPEMPVLLFTGPLAGTAAPASGKTIIAARSPLTGTVGDNAVGGRLGVQLKAAGLDGIIVKGCADNWTGIEIHNNHVRLQSANHFVGCSVSEVTNHLHDWGSVAVIGPAAERGVRFASVVVDRIYSAQRGGIGLNFAAKKLKYIAVTGSGEVAVANENMLQTAREDVLRLASASSILKGELGFSRLGTPALYDLMHARRMMPTANFRRTVFESAPSLNASVLSRTFHPRSVGCEGCPIQCMKEAADKNLMPDFDTLSHFTALIENAHLQTVIDAGALCGEMGMDPVSAASTLACYSELRNETLSPDRILTLLEQMGAAQGDGAALSQGSLAFATAESRPELSMSVKGLELPAYDPRGAYGMALAYATSTRGGCALRAFPIGHEILRKPVATDRFSFGAKARIIKIAEDKNAIIDSLVTCRFMFLTATLEEYARAFTAVTDVPMTAADLSLIGERISYNDRMLNARFGITAQHDDLPMRFFTQDGTAGPAFAVPKINRADFSAAMTRYRRVRELDKNGLPQREKAETLGLTWNIW